jgi:hypothetical protein
MKKINLDTLLEGIPGITRATGAFLHEAARVAMAKNGHQSSVELIVEGDFQEIVQIAWKDHPAEETLISWKNNREAANFGAVGIALLLMLKLTEFSIFELGETGTGIDYWMGRSIPGETDFRLIKKEARLEISGIFKESSSNLMNMRVNLKK